MKLLLKSLFCFALVLSSGLLLMFTGRRGMAQQAKTDVSLDTVQKLPLRNATSYSEHDIAPSNPPQDIAETNVVRRYLGFLQIGLNKHYVLLTDDQVQNLYVVNFSLSTAQRGFPGDWEKFGLGAWLLGTNGTALTPLGVGGPGWFRGAPSASFVFKRKECMADLYAMVLKVGETTHIVRIVDCQEMDLHTGKTWPVPLKIK